jgi:hypothetical protein
MTYLNIQTENNGFSIEIPTTLRKRTATDLWYTIENRVDSNEVTDYKKGKNAKYEIVTLDWQTIKNEIRQENNTLKRQVRTSDLVKLIF